ncbi:MAG: DEAD/DEAH box helicase [Candidatus Woesearchaeota archaeon]
MLKITPRLYQEKIFNAAVSNNTLVVLPTGLGKTAVAAMMIHNRLANYKGSKIIFLAPTKPLAQQHEKTLKEYLPVYEDKIVLFTGSVSPEKRELLWKDNQIIISTPQGLENDVIRRKVNLRDVSLVIFDEAHRATGDYAYVFIAKKYVEQSNYVRIMALTASPGSNQEKILEVCNNLFIEEIEYRSKEDEDVKPYVQEIDIKHIEVELPEEFKKVKMFLEKCYFSKLEGARALGVLTGDPKSYNKSNLLQMLASLHGKMRSGEKDYETLKTISLLAESLKVQHALDLIESQGLEPTISYLLQLKKEAQTSRVKAVKNLVQDINFKSALILSESLSGKVVHPKLIRLKELVKKQLELKKESKIIIFSQYRESGANIKKILEEINISSELFFGQAKKNNTGLSQKKQKEMIENFASNNFSCLIATSVGEEGLDIPEVDLVIFYEPVPSAIRSVQRRGRTGRQKEGKVFMLITKNTKDEAYRWSSFHKEKRMYRVLKNIKTTLTPKVEEKTLHDFDEDKIRIKADFREKGSALLKELLSQRVEIDLESLPVGDYHVSKDVVVEFKTIPDFVDSILDGRILSQARDLRQYKKPFIIIQGDEDIYSQRRIHPNAIRGMISALTINFGIPIIRTTNPKDSCAYLQVIAKREQGDKNEFQMHTSKPLSDNSLQEYIISSFPGIGNTLAKPLLKHFKSIKNFVNSDVDKLKEVDLIGDKKAKRIREILDKDYDEK